MGGNSTSTTNNNSNTSIQTEELHLRWSRLLKQVGEMKDETTETTLTRRISKVTPVAAVAVQVIARRRRSSMMVPQKVILNRVSGEAKSGEIIALMGPSGSGKTSLMNVLSGRASHQEGTISINGKALDKQGMKRLMSKIAYVKQADIFFDQLSVRDQLTYTAQLRFPDQHVDQKERRNKIRTEVDRIIKLLRLTKVQDSPIMMCSGGEKKRVNIGTELITDPKIIMLDEPTSGLDSASAVSLLNVLKDLANQGKTIITSIHQPNSASFLNFDKLMMLSDGNVVFFGKPRDSLEYLRSKGYPCPDGYNLADHWMNMLVTDSSVEEERKEAAIATAIAKEMNEDGITDTDSSVEEERKEQDDDMVAAKEIEIATKNTSLVAAMKISESPRFYLQEAWDNDTIAIRMDVVDEIQQTDTATTGTSSRRSSLFEVDRRHGGESKYTTSWWTQFHTLTHRALKKSKSTVLSPINIVKTVAIGIVVGLVFLGQTYTENDVFNIYSYFFFTMVFWVMSGMFEALFAFPQERVIILKERATASYRLSAYFMSCTVADLPVFLFMPCIYMLISYWMIVPTLGFTTFIAIIGISFLSVMTGQAMGFLIGASFDDVQVGQAVATVVVLFLMLLGGFFARNIPIWLSWVGYLSPFMYASNAAMLVIFRFPVPCDGSGALSPMCAVGDTTSLVAAEDILASLSVTGTIGMNIALLLVFCTVPRLFTYIILRRKKGGERE